MIKKIIKILLIFLMSILSIIALKYLFVDGGFDIISSEIKEVGFWKFLWNFIKSFVGK